MGRFLFKAIKHLMPYKERKTLERKSRQIVVDPDSGDDTDLESSAKKYLSESESSLEETPVKAIPVKKESLSYASMVMSDNESMAAASG